MLFSHAPAIRWIFFYYCRGGGGVAVPPTLLLLLLPCDVRRRGGGGGRIKRCTRGYDNRMVASSMYMGRGTNTANDDYCLCVQPLFTARGPLRYFLVQITYVATIFVGGSRNHTRHRQWFRRRGWGCSVYILPCINVFFLRIGFFFLLRPLVVSRPLGSGASTKPARTPRRKCGPWPRSVARALGVRSRN